MFDNKIKAKNIKKYYVPKTGVVYFSESELTVLDNLSKLIVEYTKFIQIGDKDVTYHKNAPQQINEFTNKNRFNKSFYNWINIQKKGEQIFKPSSFFSTKQGRILLNDLRTFDIVILVYKSSQINSLEYVKELVDVLAKNDVFTFHYVIENFVSNEESKKYYEKLVNAFTRKKQIFVPIKEKSVVSAYTQSTISNRNYYINLYVNNLIESFLSPFLDPIKNPDHFSRVKALFYQDLKTFDSKAITTIGYSDEKKERVDLALIQALSNPIFYGAFGASNTFIVNVKAPFFEDTTIKRIEYVLKHIVGEEKTFLISSYVGSYDYDVYCQITIMAINVDETRLIEDTSKIKTYVKSVLTEVQKSNDLFDSKTKELVLKNQISLLDE